MRAVDVELNVPPGGHPRLVEIVFLEGDGIRNRAVLERAMLEKLVSEAQQVLDYWNGLGGKEIVR